MSYNTPPEHPLLTPADDFPLSEQDLRVLLAAIGFVDKIGGLTGPEADLQIRLRDALDARLSRSTQKTTIPPPPVVPPAQ